MPKLIHLISAFVFLIAAILNGSQTTSLETINRNEIAVDPEGWFTPTSGDPYLVFDAKNYPIDSDFLLEVNFSARHAINRHLYIEVFWASESHGFTESMKGFYIQPIAHNPKDSPSVKLNLGEFMQAMGETGKVLSLVRIDLDPRGLSQDFQFSCEVTLLQGAAATGNRQPVTSIHPPYLGRFIMDWRIFRYVVMNLINDLMARFFRDPVFLLLYLPSLAMTVLALVMVTRTRKSHRGSRPPEASSA